MIILLVVMMAGALFLGASVGAVERVTIVATAFFLWLIIAFVTFVWNGLGVNSCVEYGYTNSGTCSNEDIRKHIEKEES